MSKSLRKEIIDLKIYLKEFEDNMLEEDKKILNKDAWDLDYEKELVILRNKIMYGEGKEKLEKLSA
jgi:hypothetical protein